jgi:hypothetical protein
VDLQRLRRLTHEILDPLRPPYSLREDVLELVQVLDDLASFEMDPSEDIGTGETLGHAGLALSPTMAALCAQHYTLTDACRYQIPSDRLPHVSVSETMNAALESEPQVALARHLLGQAPAAILVPSSVRVDAALLDPSKEFGEHRLSDYDSGLTIPRPFPTESVVEAGRTLQFRYRLGVRPGLTCVVC